MLCYERSTRTFGIDRLAWQGSHCTTTWKEPYFYLVDATLAKGFIHRLVETLSRRSKAHTGRQCNEPDESKKRKPTLDPHKDDWTGHVKIQAGNNSPTAER